MNQVAHKLALTYENLGEQRVKNIAQPVRAYRVLSNPDGAASLAPTSNVSGVHNWRKTMVAALCTLTVAVGIGLS